MYYRCFQDALDPDKFDFYTSLVMEEVTQQDFKHLSKTGGRRREGKIRRGKFHPYLSHLKHYAIDRNSTGNPEYDLIFIRIGEQLQERLQSDEDVLSNLSIEELQKKSEKSELLFGDSLSALMQIWENIHPGEKFIPVQWKIPTG